MKTVITPPHESIIKIRDEEFVNTKQRRIDLSIGDKEIKCRIGWAFLKWLHFYVNIRYDARPIKNVNHFQSSVIKNDFEQMKPEGLRNQ